MYKGFFEDIEYVMGLFCKPFEECFKADEDEDDEEEKNCCAMGCDQMPCMRDDDSEDDDEKEEGKEGGLMGPGPVADMLKCMFDASDIDYDYED